MVNKFGLRASLLFAAVLVVTGCSSNGSAIREAAYLDQLDAARGSYSDATLITAGQEVCADVADGNGDAAFAGLTEQVGLVNMMRVMSAAFTELCPDVVPDEMQGTLNELQKSVRDLDQSLHDFGAKYGS